MANLTFELTADGSKTIYNPTVGENYHSRHGAVQESKHVFLQSGLQFFLERFKRNSVSILEVGFGTGLNFLLSADYCIKNGVKLQYSGIEALPLSLDMISQTEYENYIDGDMFSEFLQNYESSLNQSVIIGPECNLRVLHGELSNFDTEETYDLIYFDAFAAVHQPEMWTKEALECCCRHLKPGGVFVTYAITGNLKRAMRDLGFEVEKAPGAPGKREMLRAVKR